MTTIMKYRTGFAALALSLSLTGCGSLVETAYRTPAVTMPEKWQQGGADATFALQGKWWQQFDDAALDALVEQALASNNDLAASAIRIRRAQLNAGITAAGLWPTLSGGASGMTTVPSSNGTAGLTSANGVITSNNYSSDVSISYELDLWGKLSKQTDAAKFEAQATVQDKEATAMTLTGTVANTYWKLGYLNQRIALADASLAYAKKTLEITETKHAAGAVSALDVATAQQSIASQQAARASLIQQQVEARNTLSVLFDGPPGKVFAEPRHLPTASLPAIPAGLPAEILSRRPDLRAAELRLRESLATADATRASYYPALSLTGEVSGGGGNLLKLFNNPVSTITANLTLPFLDWNRSQLTIKVSQSQFDEAVVNFRQTLYAALSEVENALSNRVQLAEEARQQEINVAAARKIESGNQVRYSAGKVALKIWLEAQESRRQAEISLADARLSQLSNYVTLVKALGGEPVYP
jgi:NodT family efflux transporter outer membrane factor (OMF) lipoprotein